MIDFLSQIETLLLNMLKLFKIQGFFSDFCSKLQFFHIYFKNCQILGFSGFQVKWQPCNQLKGLFNYV